jgi:isoleucyl-tRNA synthetase
VASRPFPSPPTIQDLPRSEAEIIKTLEARQVFEQSVEQTKGGKPFVFFEGPPTANNIPHIGHALTRAIKDVVPRFRTMQGRYVARKAGWDTHGLPVEIAIEKKLGFTGKEDVEKYGVEAFNDQCFQSVRKYEREWVTASKRLGFWLDYDDPYFTFTNTYVESVWWILNQMFEKDMLYEGHKVLPYCPLCGTTHSSHEVSQGYVDVKDPSVTVAFEVLPGQSRGDVSLDGAHLLAWTTTPWTLPSNMATCVHPEHTYKLVQSTAHPERRYLLAENMATPVEEMLDNKPIDLRESEAIATFRGAELEGLQYQPLFDFTGTGSDAETDRGVNWTVCVDPYVTLDSGTGIVHMAPAFGEDDHRVGAKYSLAMYCAMRLDGKFRDHAGRYAGLWFKDADREILDDLKASGRLVRSLKYEHPYPHCWRHDTPLYYFATSSWFVRTTSMKDALVAGNQTINWRPNHIKGGRFGKWLDGVVDWALSRKRYWGTPLPIWRCNDEECGKLECMGSYASLFERAGMAVPADAYDRDEWNPHRPYVDDISFACSAAGCSGTMSRVVEVIDCWFDAGAMPFAQHHYPFNTEMAAKIDSGEAFPADFISEAVDQTRGWFYTLHVISTFLTGGPAYKSCVVLGHVLDEQGKKMSKSKGNAVATDDILDKFGADAFRWFFYRGNPTVPSRFGPNAVRESLKSYLLPLLNAWSFFSIYANLDGFSPAESKAPAFADRPALDRWILSVLSQTTTEVTEALEDNHLNRAAAALESLLELLTNWYIRRSRRRFWKAGEAGSDEDKAAAYWTLYDVLVGIAHLSAPFTPFLAHRLHCDLVRSQQENPIDSVHLASWPIAGPVDEDVLQQMDAARRAVGLGHSARQDARIGVRQPLQAVTIVSVDDALLMALRIPEVTEVVREELNVREVRFAEDRAAYVTYQVKANFRALGKRVGKRMKLVAAAIGQLDPATTVAAWEADGSVTVVPSDGDAVVLSGDDLDVRIQQREGTTSAFDEVALVALDTVLTDELVQEGLARECINRIQGERKERDLSYDHRIALQFDGSDAVVSALAAYGGLVSGEVLAASFEHVPGLSGVTKELRGDALVFQFEVTSS